jgi:carotene epsilon-monooxygenase
VSKVFIQCSLRTADVLAAKLDKKAVAVNMEQIFSELTLDIIGKAVFNYDFKSVEEEGENPVIAAVYTALKETEARALDFTPFWKLPGDLPTMVSPRQKRAADAVALIRKTTEDLIENCRLQLEAEEAAGTAAQFNEEDYLVEQDPSVLRFLIASQEEVKSSQLRDDLLGMLVAGHETTASVLTWTLYLLTKHPEKMVRVQEEIDSVLGAKIMSGNVTFDDAVSPTYLRWCIFESMRLYPHPPVLIRRALQDDLLPNGWLVPKGQDVMISVYNIHHSASVWSNPEDFLPERWSKYVKPRDTPNERNTDYHYIPFSGGARRCVGDQFALLESNLALAVLLHRFDFRLVEDHDIGMTTGATIHTTNGMMMTYAPRT